MWCGKGKAAKMRRRDANGRVVTAKEYLRKYIVSRFLIFYWLKIFFSLKYENGPFINIEVNNFLTV
jgi:hypothetical protein